MQSDTTVQIISISLLFFLVFLLTNAHTKERSQWNMGHF